VLVWDPTLFCKHNDSVDIQISEPTELLEQLQLILADCRKICHSAQTVLQWLRRKSQGMLCSSSDLTKDC
jgi:hypothetical protein